jgi:hypothetical protein
MTATGAGVLPGFRQGGEEVADGVGIAVLEAALGERDSVLTLHVDLRESHVDVDAHERAHEAALLLG